MDNLFFNRKGRPKYVDDVIPAYKNGYFALLVKENKILLTYPPGVGVPEFPGGSIRRSENFRDCLFRKLYEETGVEFMLDKGVRQFEQTVNYFADDEKPSGMFYIYHQFLWFMKLTLMVLMCCVRGGKHRKTAKPFGRILKIFSAEKSR